MMRLGKQKVGFIDIEVVLRDSKVGRETGALLQKEHESKELVLRQKKQLIENMRKDALGNGFAMNDDNRKVLVERILEQQKDFDRTLEDFRVEMDRREQDFRQNALKEIKDIVIKIGKEREFDIIVERKEAGILYGGPGTDITQDVILAYDESGDIKGADKWISA